MWARGHGSPEGGLEAEVSDEVHRVEEVHWVEEVSKVEEVQEVEMKMGFQIA